MGINNRNLQTFEGSLETTLALRDMVDPIASSSFESGIHTQTDVQRMRARLKERIPGWQAFMRARSQAGPGRPVHPERLDTMDQPDQLDQLCQPDPTGLAGRPGWRPWWIQFLQVMLVVPCAIS